MNLLKKLKNIWALGNQEVTQIGFTKEGRVFHAYGELDVDIRPAQIIKRTTPSQDFIKQNKNEE